MPMAKAWNWGGRPCAKSAICYIKYKLAIKEEEIPWFASLGLLEESFEANRSKSIKRKQVRLFYQRNIERSKAICNPIWTLIYTCH